MEHFNSKSFIDSLLTQNKNDLSLGYTLLVNTNMLSLLTSSLSDKFNKTNNSFESKIAEAATAYSDWSEEELTIQIILTLNKTLVVPPTYYGTVRDLYENGEHIANRTAPILREMDKKFKGSTFDDFMKYQYMKLFKQSLDQVNKLSDDEYDQFETKVDTFIKSLPIEQQERLKKEIGVDELTKAAIHKSILNGSFGVGFATVVGIGGFPIYMATASLVSSVFGVVGLTLPFGFYTGMSSFMAVLANPLFLIPALGLGGFFLFKNGKEKLNRMLALIFITQITMANDNDEAKKSPNRGNEVIASWNCTVTEYNSLVKQLNAVHVSYKKTQLSNNELQRSYELKLKQKSELQNVLLNNSTKFKKLIATMTSNELTIYNCDNSLNTQIAKIVEYKKLLVDKQLKLIVAESAHKNNPKDSLLLTERKTIQKECRIIQKGIDEETSALVMEIEKKAVELKENKVVGFSKDYIDNYTELDKQLSEAVYQTNQLTSDLKVSKQYLDKLRSEVRGSEVQVRAFDQRYYGIEKIHHFQEKEAL